MDTIMDAIMDVIQDIRPVVNNTLYDYIKYNNVNKIKEYLDNNLNYDINECRLYHVNNFESKNCTPLIIAIHYNNFNIVKLLLQNYNADISKCDTYGFSPLITAASLGYLDMVEYLLNNGADINYGNLNFYGVAALHMACANKQYDTIKYLVKNGSNLENINRFLYVEDSIRNIIVDCIITKLKKIISIEIIKKFLLKKVVLHYNSIYIKRIANSF
jgi:ankyrin repeat protein